MMSSQMIRSRRLHKIDELTQLKNNYYRILHSLTPRGCLFWMSSTSENVLQLWICSPARPPSYNFSYIIYCLSTASYSFLFYVDDVICHFVTLLVYVRRCPQCSVLMKTLMLIRAPKNKLSRSSKTKKQSLMVTHSYCAAWCRALLHCLLCRSHFIPVGETSFLVNMWHQRWTDGGFFSHSCALFEQIELLYCFVLVTWKKK